MVPTIQLLIIPLAADFEIKNINISIIDRDHSSYSGFTVSRPPVFPADRVR
jgi:ABC-2 type transport system permease protein